MAFCRILLFSYISISFLLISFNCSPQRNVGDLSPNIFVNINLGELLQNERVDLMEVDFNPNAGRDRRQVYETRFGKQGEHLIQQLGNGGIEKSDAREDVVTLPTLMNEGFGMKLRGTTKFSQRPQESAKVEPLTRRTPKAASTTRQTAKTTLPTEPTQKPISTRSRNIQRTRKQNPESQKSEEVKPKVVRVVRNKHQ